MKKTHLKKFWKHSIPVLGCVIGSALAGPVCRAADDLPAVQAPAGFDEGTESSLNATQMSEILPWAENSRETLKDLLDTTSSFSYREAKETMVRGIQDVVLASAPKRTELLTRYVLNRALKTHALIEREVDTTQPGVVDLQVRFLRNSIQMALKYFVSDVAYLNGRFVEKKADLASMPYAEFGLDYAQFLMTLDQSVLDASAQYDIAVQALGLLEWDLYRDQDRLLYAPVISKIDRFLKLAPAQAGASDGDSIRWLRKVKKVYQDSIKSLISLRTQANKPVPAELESVAPVNYGTFNTSRKEFNYGMSVRSAAQLPTIRTTCAESGSSEAQVRCYNAMLDTLVQDKMLTTIRGICGKLGSLYHQAQCLDQAMSSITAGQDYLSVVSGACTVSGANSANIAECLSDGIKSPQDHTLAVFNNACAGLGNTYYTYNCVLYAIAGIRSRTEAHKLANTACELSDLYTSSLSSAGRVACYRAILPEFADPQLNTIALGCAAKGNTYYEANCYRDAIAARVQAN